MRTPGPQGDQRVRGWGAAYLVTDMQGEDDREDASGRVPPVALQPAVEHVLDEGRVVDENLRGEAQGPEHEAGEGATPTQVRAGKGSAPTGACAAVATGAQRGAELTNALALLGVMFQRENGKRQRPKSQTQQTLELRDPGEK